MSLISSNLIGEWRFDEGSGQQVFNRVNTPVASANLLPFAELFLGQATGFVAGGGALTFTPFYTTDPNGGNNAARVQSSAAVDVFLQMNQTIPAGTWTISCYVKSNTGLAQNVRQRNASAFTTDKPIAATGWTRISTTFTLASPTSLALSPLANDAAHSALDVSVWGIELIAGSSPSATYQTPSGDFTLGKALITEATVDPDWASSGITMPNGSTRYAHTAFNAPVTAGSLSVYAVFRIPLANAIANTPTLLGEVFASNKFYLSTGQQNSSAGELASFQFNNTLLTCNGATTHDGLWHTLAATYDGATQRIYIDGTEIASSATVLAAITIQRLFLNYVTGSAWFTGDIGYELLYNAAHTGAQVKAQHAALQTIMAGRSVTLNTLDKFVAYDGDSITAGFNVTGGTPVAFPLTALRAMSPIIQGRNFAVTGAYLKDWLNNGNTNTLEYRAATVDALIDNTRPNNILHVLIGTNDFTVSVTTAQFLTALASYYAARKTAGWQTVIVGTILPCTTAGFNTWRNTINAALRAASAGTYWDVLADYAADATVGTDAAASNATYYPDGKHPSATATPFIRTITVTALTNAISPDVTPPTVSSRTVPAAGTTISLQMSEFMSSAGSISDYAVTVDGVARSLSSVSYAGSVITLTPSSVIGIGQTVTVAYTQGTAKDLSNNLLATFTAQAVTNNSTVDITPSAVPTNLRVTAADGRLYIEWNSVGDSDVAGYELDRNGTTVTLLNVLVYAHSGLTNGTAYTYRVRSYDTSGNRSAWSSAVIGTPRAASGSGRRLIQSRSR